VTMIGSITGEVAQVYPARGWNALLPR